LALTLPAFAGINFGFAGTDASDVRAVCTAVVPGEIQVRTQPVVFNGVDGMADVELGSGGRQVAWEIWAWFVSEAAAGTWRKTIEAKATERWTLNLDGSNFSNTKLRRFYADGPRLPGDSHFAFARRYYLEFEILDPKEDV